VVEKGGCREVLRGVHSAVRQKGVRRKLWTPGPSGLGRGRQEKDYVIVGQIKNRAPRGIRETKILIGEGDHMEGDKNKKKQVRNEGRSSLMWGSSPAQTREPSDWWRRDGRNNSGVSNLSSGGCATKHGVVEGLNVGLKEKRGTGEEETGRGSRPELDSVSIWKSYN